MPEHVAVPFAAVAVVDAAVLPEPVAVITKAVDAAIALVPVRTKVAVPPVLPLLKPDSKHVCPALPVAVMPLVYVPDVRPPDGVKY